MRRHVWLPLVAVCLLASIAASAYAECAWVMWSHVYVMKDGKVADDFYSPDEGYPYRYALS